MMRHIQVDRWSSLRLLWLHAALLAAALVIVVAVVDNGSIAVNDEGVYATQAQSLSEGSWWSQRPAADADPDGAAIPLMDSTVRGDEIIAYGRHPLYPLVITPAFEIGGYSGALFTSAAGVLAAALAAAFLARRLAPKYGIPALWAAGLGCPLAVDAPVLWAHAMAAACAGLAYLGVARALDGRRVGVHLAYAVPAAMATVMLRSEGILFVSALGAISALEVIPAWRRADRRRGWTAASVGSGFAVLSATTYLLDSRISEWIGGGGGYGANVSTLVLGEKTGPSDAIWVSLIRPWIGSYARANHLSGLVFVLLAVLAIRFLPRSTAVPFVLVVFAPVAIVASLFWGGVEGAALITGLFPAFPALSAAILLVRRSDFGNAEFRRAIALALVVGSLLVGTIYDIGGATEWGGRYFHILLVPLIGPMIWVIDQRRTVFEPVERRVLFACVGVLLLGPSLVGLNAIRTAKKPVALEVEALARVAADMADGDGRPLAAVWRINRDGSSRQFWALGDQVDVLQLGRYPSVSAFLALPAVRERGTVVVVTDVSASVFKTLFGSGAGWKLDEASSVSAGRVTFLVVRLDQPA